MRVELIFELVQGNDSVLRVLNDGRAFPDLLHLAGGKVGEDRLADPSAIQRGTIADERSRC